MNKQKKILIIGAGINQLPIIQTAKELGYYVIAMSCKGNYPGFDVADEAVYMDVFDLPNIIEFARVSQIDGVLSDQSDMIAPVVAQVAETLGLPTWGYENALDFTDKSRMRALYQRLGLPVPLNRATTIVEEAIDFAQETDYPIVIKPADSFASRGVFIIYNEQELKELYPQSYDCSRAKKVIVEQYISGPQYFCQGFVDNGELTLYAFSDRYYFNLPHLSIPYTNAFPAKIDDALKNRMEEMFRRVVNAAHPTFGHVWAEWIYNDATDTLYIVETAIRGAGAYVTSHLLPAAYGVDSQPYLVRAAMGDSDSMFKKQKFDNKSAAFYCFLLPEGVVASVKGLNEVADIPGVVQTNLKSIEIGEEIPAIKDKSSRFGPIIVKGDTREEIEVIWNKIQKTIQIQVKTKDGLKGPIWD